MKNTLPPAEPRHAGDSISRMPRKIRDAVSSSLIDGGNWRAIAAICQHAGFTGIQPQNVTNYRNGAHKEWLARQERLEAIRRDSETTAAVVRHYSENGGSPAEAGLLAAAEIMASALAGLGPEAMQILIADDPKALFGIVRELSRVATLLQRKGEVADLKAASTPADSAQVLTPEERAAAMKQIFGLA